MKMTIIFGLILCIIFAACAYMAAEPTEKKIIQQEENLTPAKESKPEDAPPKKFLEDLETIEEAFEEKCDFPPGLYCKETLSITPSTIEFVMKNDKGLPIVLKEISGPKSCTTVKVSPSVTLDYQPFSERTINAGGAFKVMLAGCNNGEKGHILEESITIKYMNKMTEIEYDANGIITGIVS